MCQYIFFKTIKDSYFQYNLYHSQRYWVGCAISFKSFRGYGSGMGLGDTRPDYSKPHTRLPELYTRPRP
ncbi:hypothetical protein Hanom_Chr03g00201511 [Helianthus anomalus]